MSNFCIDYAALHKAVSGMAAPLLQQLTQA